MQVMYILCKTIIILNCMAVGRRLLLTWKRVVWCYRSYTRQLFHDLFAKTKEQFPFLLICDLCDIWHSVTSGSGRLAVIVHSE